MFKKLFRRFQEAPVTVTLKGGPTFESPWVIVKGNSSAEVRDILRSNDTDSLLSEVSEKNELFQRMV